MRALPPVVRRAGLTLHVLTSVGWAGAVLVYLALGVAVATSADRELVRGVHLAMDWAAWVVLVPLALASLLSGVVQGLATPWGLFRHYWVVIKLVITATATVVLVAYTQTLSSFAEVASGVRLSDAELALLQSPSVIVHATGALLLLVTATVLAVYKPAGMTRHGQRQRFRSAR